MTVVEWYTKSRTGECATFSKEKGAILSEQRSFHEPLKRKLIELFMEILQFRQDYLKRRLK